MPIEIDDTSDAARITIQPYRGALIASIQVDLDDRVLRRFQSDLLQCIQSSGVITAIIDLSGVHVMDAHDFEGLRRVIQMASLMGTETILCSIQPGVAAALVDLNVPLDDLRVSLNLDAALAEFAGSASQDEQAGPPEELTNQESESESAEDEAIDPE